MATTNPARYHNFRHLGSLAPGYQADVLCFADARDLVPDARVAARPAGRPRAARVLVGVVPSRRRPSGCCATRSTSTRDLDRAPSSSTPPAGRVRVIGIEAGSLTTLPRDRRLATPRADVAPRLACVERHRGTGRIGRG